MFIRWILFYVEQQRNIPLMKLRLDKLGIFCIVVDTYGRQEKSQFKQ